MSSRFYGGLALRLGLGAVFISAALGTAVFFLESERIDDVLVERTRAEARMIEERAASIISSDNVLSLEPMLQGLLDAGHEGPGGHFILAEIYGADRKRLGEASDELAPGLAEKLDQTRHHFPPEDVWYDKLLIDGDVYIQVVTRLQKNGELIGYFEGAYHLSPHLVAQVQGDVVTAVLVVVGAVLATALLLYPVIARQQRGLLSGAQSLMRANVATLAVLGAAIAKRDSDTNAHNFRVSIYALRLGELVGLDVPNLRDLVVGAFLHDVGKIAVPDAILLKPGRLDEGEFSVMKTHVLHGLDIVNQSAFLKAAAEVVRGNHEKVDGSGYPDGLRGTEIPVNARIFAIADVFDALTSQRPYKEPMSLEKALAIMEEGRDRHFDGQLLDLFRQIAPQLHQQYGGREDSGMETELRHAAEGYFQIDLRSSLA